MTTKKKIHPADKADRDAVFLAASFNAFYREGPNVKHNAPADRLSDAIKRADELAADQFERRGKKVRPLIYAIHSNGNTIPVPAAMIAEVRAGKYDIDPTLPLAKAKQIEGKAKPKANPAEAVKNVTKGTVSVAKAIEAKVAERKAKPDMHAGSNKLIAEALASEPKTAKPLGKRAAIQEAAERGELPEAPDFSAKTHERFRGKLEQIVAMVGANDIEGLKNFPINPVSSSPKALDRYRNLAVTALEAKGTLSK